MAVRSTVSSGLVDKRRYLPPMGQETMTTGDRLTTAIIGGSAVSGVALIVAAIIWSWPPQTLAGLLQVLGLALAAVGVGVVHTELQRVIAGALGAKTPPAIS
jgi:hypothetical protein